MQTDRLQKLLAFLENEPNDEFLQYALATEYLRLNKTDEALKYYEGLIANHPKYIGTYYHLGKLYEALKRPEDAIITYKQGMQVARELRDNHALSELMGVYNQLAGDEDDDY